MSKYGLAKAAGYNENDSLITAGEVEERIVSRANEDKKYIDLLEHMSDESKAELFMKVVRSTEWMIGEAILYEDLIDEAFDDTVEEEQEVD